MMLDTSRSLSYDVCGFSRKKITAVYVKGGVCEELFDDNFEHHYGDELDS